MQVKRYGAPRRSNDTCRRSAQNFGVFVLTGATCRYRAIDTGRNRITLLDENDESQDVLFDRKIGDEPLR